MLTWWHLTWWCNDHIRLSKKVDQIYNNTMTFNATTERLHYVKEELYRPSKNRHWRTLKALKNQIYNNTTTFKAMTGRTYYINISLSPTSIRCPVLNVCICQPPLLCVFSCCLLKLANSPVSSLFRYMLQHSSSSVAEYRTKTVSGASSSHVCFPFFPRGIGNRRYEVKPAGCGSL